MLSDINEYHIGKYGRIHSSYLKEHRLILYADFVVTEAWKAADRMEWVRRVNSIHDRTEEIILYGLIHI